MSIFKTILLTMLTTTLLNLPAKSVSDAAEKVHPVVVDSCLIGGMVNGKWMDASVVAPKLTGGEKYRLYTLTARTGEGVGTKPKVMADYCSDTMEIELSPRSTNGTEVLAVGGEWNAMPRSPQLLDKNGPVYRAAVADILRSKRFVKPRINIAQVLRVDLDGDGRDEVLVSASYYTDGMNNDAGPMATRPKSGDYSFVLLRRLIRGKLRNIIIDGEFYPAIKADTGPPNQYIVSAVGDVDGDGIMEVIVRSDYYEGGSSTIYSVKGNKIKAMTSCGCGA